MNEKSDQNIINILLSKSSEFQTTEKVQSATPFFEGLIFNIVFKTLVNQTKTPPTSSSLKPSKFKQQRRFNQRLHYSRDRYSTSPSKHRQIKPKHPQHPPFRTIKVPNNREGSISDSLLQGIDVQHCPLPRQRPQNLQFPLGRFPKRNGAREEPMHEVVRLWEMHISCRDVALGCYTLATILPDVSVLGR